MSRIIDLRKKQPQAKEKSALKPPLSRKDLAAQAEPILIERNANVPLKPKEDKKANQSEKRRLEAFVDVSEKIEWKAAAVSNKRAKKQLLWISLGAFLIAILTWWLKMGFTTIMLFLTMTGMVFIKWRSKTPEINVRISLDGITLNEKTYKFTDIKSFWIEYNPGGLKELSLEMRHWYLPYLKIALMRQDPVKIRNFLIKFIPEKEHDIILTDAFLKRE